MKKVSTAMSKQDRNFSQPTLTIGLDLGDRNSWYCVLDEAGQIQLEQRVRTTAKGLQAVFAALPPGRIALEAGTHSPWVSRPYPHASIGLLIKLIIQNTPSLGFSCHPHCRCLVTALLVCSSNNCVQSHATPPANQFVRRIIDSELQAEKNDYSHWMLRLETQKSGKTEVREVVET